MSNFLALHGNIYLELGLQKIAELSLLEKRQGFNNAFGVVYHELTNDKIVRPKAC